MVRHAAHKYEYQSLSGRRWPSLLYRCTEGDSPHVELSPSHHDRRERCTQADTQDPATRPGRAVFRAGGVIQPLQLSSTLFNFRSPTRHQMFQLHLVPRSMRRLRLLRVTSLNRERQSVIRARLRQTPPSTVPRVTGLQPSKAVFRMHRTRKCWLSGIESPIQRCVSSCFGCAVPTG